MVYPGARAARDPDRKELEPSRKSRSPRRPADGRETARATWPRASKGVDERMKTVFTTGEAAKICKVSQQTIIRCFDNGQLKGFRVPGSRFRRIPREALYKFMKDNGIPTDALESGKRKVLLVDDDAELVELILKFLDEDGRFETRVAQNGFDAGMMVKEYHPDLIVLDVMLPDINGKEVCQRVRADSTLEDVRILCMSGMVEEDKIQELKLAGADDFIHKPFEVETLIERMCAQLDLEPAEASA
jgi:excisionase family DNA binding protein